MPKVAISIVITAVIILVLVLMSGLWMNAICLPFEVHTFKWQCELAFPFLGLSFAAPAALHGYLVSRSPWIDGPLISIIAAVIAAKLSYFQPFFSTQNSITFATYAFFLVVLPGIVGTLVGHRLQSLLRSDG